MEMMRHGGSFVMSRMIGRISGFRCRSSSTFARGASQSYSHTVLLPKTPFPAKIEGQKRVDADRSIVSSDRFAELYYRQRDEKKPEYILHDGPPYANGVPHMGHAVNKILKDITVRWKMINGHKIHYKPGWDCHGLPIELKALQSTEEIRLAKDSPLKLRKIARNFAEQVVGEQKKEFMSWGVIGDWKEPYQTMSPNFVKMELRAFYEMYRKGFVYQSYLPVYWSPSSRTALAESELEYKQNHKSVAVYVRFPVIGRPNLYLLIWTTTPWSLVANRAICYDPDAIYCEVKHSESTYIVGEQLLSNNKELKEIFGENPEITQKLSGNEIFEGLRYSHCLTNCGGSMPTLASSHVTSDTGTGLVHTAPAHGPDDYQVGLKNNLDLSCPVDENGCYDDEVLLEDLKGEFVLGGGNEKVLALLKLQGNTMLEKEFIHSYPYDWRTKKPVILRASKQWFIDSGTLQERGKEELSKISIHPSTAVNGFKGVLEKRPYWCISRQRVWGVPIPIFYNSNDEAVITNEVIERCQVLVDEHGPDFWWKLEATEILKGTELESQNLRKGTDVLDVWFDSGVSWNVIPKSGAVRKSEVYLEGLDQFSGWFYSSLLIGIGLQGTSPYRKLYVHGFTLDENGRKMSKSLGNVVAPSEVTGWSPTLKKTDKKSKAKIKRYGVDVLRWWVAAHGSQNTGILIGNSMLSQSKMEVDRLRNTIKFLLGNEGRGNLPYEEIDPIGQYMLHKLSSYEDEVSKAYDKFAYHTVVQKTQHLVASDISAFYFSIVKDTLYCDALESAPRRSAVTVLSLILRSLLTTLHPILPVLTFEVSNHVEDMKFPPEFESHAGWKNQAIFEKIHLLREMRDSLNNKFLSMDLKIKDCDLLICPSEPSTKQALDLLPTKALSNIFGCARVELTLKMSEDTAPNLKIEEIPGFSFITKRTNNLFCQRCRLNRIDDCKEPDLCSRCQDVVK